MKNPLLMDPFAIECLNSMENGRVVFHDIGPVPTKNITENIRDKLEMDRLGIQRIKGIGNGEMYTNLLKVNNPEVQVCIITTENGAFRIVADYEFSTLIGIIKYEDVTIEQDISHQREMGKLGHPNKIYLYDRGSFVEKL